MKYKILSSGTLVTCDGFKHTYNAIDEKLLVHQPNSALCWCQSAGEDQLERWSDTKSQARDKARLTLNA